MLIGVSGSHCTGKSTLIDSFCELHPEFTRLAEPYEELDDLWAEVSTEMLLDQLDFQIEQLSSLETGDVIVERTPLDFVAYLEALNEVGRGSFSSGKHFELARKSTRRFDLIVFVPIDGASIYVPDEEDLELRKAVNERLTEVLNDSDVGPRILEVRGSVSHRLEMLERAVSSFALPHL